MQLETYISDLLYRYECVTVPEFGAFLTQRMSATINNSTNTFYPPKKRVSFNEQIQKNDGLLAHYIADVEKIPFEVATEKIKKRVKFLKSLLTQGETITFNNIGEIVFNREGKIVFEPSYHLNYLTDSFGLTQLVSPTVTREIYKETAEAIEKEIPVAFTIEKRRSKNYLKYAAVALIALSLGGIVASNYYVNQIETYNQLAQEQASQQLETKIQQATFNLSPLPAITLNVTKQTGNYHIIAGAFRIEENCDKIIAKLRADGFNARKIGINKYGLHEVVYASYENRIDALNSLRTIKRTHNKDAWIKVDSNSENAVLPTTIKPADVPAQIEVLKPKIEQPLNSTISKESSKSPNVIKIIKDIKGLESGFYLIFDVFKDTQKRDNFLTEFKSNGGSDINFFFDSESGAFYIYNKKYETLGAATNAFKLEEVKTSHNNMFLVKVVN